LILELQIQGLISRSNNRDSDIQGLRTFERSILDVELMDI